MNAFWAIVMGIFQGMTEFFPVSSSAHLTLLPWIFKYPDPGLAFDIALHAGTLVAIIIALWPDWLDLGRKAFRFEKKSLRFLGFLALTSIPGAIFGVIFEDQAATAFRNPLIVAVNLILFGLILWWIDRHFDKSRGQDQMMWSDSLLIGLSQAFAIVPGVSRSGATISAGRALSFSRETAVKYSFMAALPIILGATLWGLRDVPPSTLISPLWFIGFLTSLVASVFAMKFLLKYVRNHDFTIFVWWRVILAALVILLMIIRR